MNKIYFSILLVSISVLFFGCSPKDNINPNNNPSGNQIWMPGSDLGIPLKNMILDNGELLISGAVTKMVQFNNELYVGGDFEIIGGKIIFYLAKWDGSKWSSVGTIDGPVKDLIVFQNKLFIQVNVEIRNRSMYKLISWDGNSLSQEDIIIDASEYFIGKESWDEEIERWTVHNDKLFLYAENQSPDIGSNWDNLIWYDGKSWTTDPEINLHHGVLTSFQGKLYSTVYDGTTNSSLDDDFGFYRFNGDFDNLQASKSWENVAGVTLEGPKIRTVVEYGNNLIVGGPFQTLDGKQISNIASFDGTNWSKFTSWGIDFPYELKVHNNKLYGSFNYGKTSNGPPYYERVAVYNNLGWQSLEYNLSDFNLVGFGGNNTIEIFDGFLYLGGKGASDNFVKLQQ
jgi:hypothetical protein